MPGVWEAFFDRLAPRYLENPYTRDTVAEVGFLLSVLDLPPGGRVLDVGCGTGRHCVELARRGYRATGLDISAGMLAEAAKAAAAAGVRAEWVKADAARFRPPPRFDAAVCLMQGAFGLVEPGVDPSEHDRAILANVRAALRPGARFALVTLNAFARLRTLTQEDVSAGRFDPATMIESSTSEWGILGLPPRIRLRERRYTPPELAAMFTAAGFTVEHLWGATFSDWSRRPIDLDDPEVMIVGTT